MMAGHTAVAPTGPAASLAVGCVTTERPARLAAVLHLLRPVAAEIVVAAHERIEPALLGPLIDVADDVVRFESSVSRSSLTRWLAAQCTCSRMLVLGDDEMPSTSLVSALTELAGDDDVDQTLIARRWLFPTVDSWLAERPWWPDFRTRLVRPECPVAPTSTEPRCVGPATRYAAEPFYDLTCVTTAFGARRRRARDVDATTDRPSEHAGPLLTPEHFATRRPASTPAEDLVQLRVILSAQERRTAPALLPMITASSIDGDATTAPPVQVSRIDLELVDADLRVDPGQDASLLVAVTNRGDDPLRRTGGQHATWLACRILDRRPGLPRRGWLPTPLPGDVPAGESRLVPVVIPVPATTGTFIGEVSVVREDERRSEVTFELVVAPRWGRFAHEPAATH